jgi:hypothetical protein
VEEMMTTLFPADRRRIYEEESVRLEAQEEFRRQKGKKLIVIMSSGCLMLILTGGILFAVAYYSVKSQEVPAGTVVTLRGSQTDLVLVFLDFDALVQYELDKNTILYLAYHNRVAMVAGGTKARIEESGSTLIRILEGTHAGKTGYAEETDIIYPQPKKSK